MSRPSHEEIQIRAYQLWENRGRPWGTPEIDWFQAERELGLAPDHKFAELAREVGGALGSIVSFVEKLANGSSTPGAESR